MSHPYDTLEGVDVDGHSVDGDVAEFTATSYGYYDAERQCWAESNLDHIVAEMRKVDPTGAHYFTSWGDLRVTILGDDGAPTAAYTRYAELIRKLSDYPLLDEMDASDRVWELAEEDVDDYLEEAAAILDYAGDGDPTRDTPLEYICMDLEDLKTWDRDDALRYIAHYWAVEVIRGS